MTPVVILPKVCGIQVPVTSTHVSVGGARSPLTAIFGGNASAAQQAICMRVTYHCPFFLAGETKPVSLTSRSMRDFLSSSQQIRREHEPAHHQQHDDEHGRAPPAEPVRPQESGERALVVGPHAARTGSKLGLRPIVVDRPGSPGRISSRNLHRKGIRQFQDQQNANRLKTPLNKQEPPMYRCPVRPQEIPLLMIVRSLPVSSRVKAQMVCGSTLSIGVGSSCQACSGVSGYSTWSARPSLPGFATWERSRWCGTTPRSSPTPATRTPGRCWPTGGTKTWSPNAGQTCCGWPDRSRSERRPPR